MSFDTRHRLCDSIGMFTQIYVLMTWQGLLFGCRILTTDFIYTMEVDTR